MRALAVPPGVSPPHYRLTNKQTVTRVCRPTAIAESPLFRTENLATSISQRGAHGEMDKKEVPEKTRIHARAETQHLEGSSRHFREGAQSSSNQGSGDYHKTRERGLHPLLAALRHSGRRLVAR